MIGMRRLLPRTLILSGLFSLALGSARASSPSLTFYVPFPEEDALTAIDAINAAAVSPVTTYISIAAVADGTVIWYDHWEDGYEKAHHLNTPVQPTTQIWGDGNPANGFPPGIPNDIIRAGTVIMLGNNVDPADPLAVDYDARDKIVASRAIAVTRTYWAGVSSTLMAGSVETYDTSKWGADYRAPVGQNIPEGFSANSGDHQMFEYTALSVMAAEDGTTVTVDADNNGVYETTNTLNEGQAFFINGGVYVGGRVTATKPVQVLMFTGDVGSNYETRDSTLLPVSLWSSSYFTPVASPSGNGTRVWLYNPGASAIAVNYRYRVGSAAAVTTNTATTVAAGSYASVLLADGSGAEFYTTGSAAPVFYAYSTTDSDSATTSDNQAWDWSYTLVPRPLLTPQVLVGLGIGRDPLSSVNPSENGNPIWVMTVGNGPSNATVYVDFDGDNAGPFTDPNGNRYDTNIVARELQPLKLYDPDGDQTAMLVYVLATNVSVAAAWGQDTATATDSAPGLDAGTAVPPVDVFDVSKALSLVADSDGDGQLGPGERISYEISIGNSSRAPVPADVLVWDALPEDTAYVVGSAAYRTSTNGAWTSIADDASGTAFPLDGNGFRIQASIPVNGGFSVRFQVDVDAFADLTSGRVSIVNTGTVTSVVYNRTLPFKNETYLHGSLGDRVWSDADGDGVQDPGEAGINGVTVYLDSNSNGVRDEAERYSVTSGDGYYLLTNALIEAGSHLVRVDRSTLPGSEYIQTSDWDGLATPDAATVSLAAGQDRADVDFGYRLPARLGDFAWVDADGDGVQDVGEPGLSNVAVLLYDNSGALVATTNTSASGTYLFSGLAQGSYTVAFVPPAGYVFTASNIGGDASDSDPLAGTNRTAAVALAAGSDDLSIDAGFYLPVSLSGSVLIDVNGNGLADGGDTNGIAGVTVLLLNAASNVIASATTSGSGGYSFSGLQPGPYTLVQVLPGGYTNTLDVVSANDLRIPVTLASGQESAGNHFYNTRVGALITQGKVLYLSDPDQALDRVDPVASGDTTSTNTPALAGDSLSAITVVGSAASSTSTRTATTHSFTYHSGTAGENRVLMVGVSYRNNDGEMVSLVTYGGQALTSVGTAQIAFGNPDGRIYIYRLVNPPTGNNTLQITWNSALNQGAVVGAVTYAGVDQSTPTGAFASSTGTSTAPSVTVGSASGQLVFGVVGGRTTSNYSVTGGGTSLWSSRPFSGQTSGSGQSKAGAASSTSLTWSGSSAEWVAGGVSLVPATISGTPSATFTQAPEFGLPFNLDEGTVVTVTGYVEVVSGTLPPSAAVSARLSAGGTPFLTVTNAAYDSVRGALVWSGALPSAVAVAAGQAIALTVSNGQSGVEFRLRYDSSAYPSKIILPTASIIAVPSLGVYDAAYSGGAPVVLSLAGTTRYIRLTATDPFGSADISGVSLQIDGPGASGDATVTLNDASVVASNGWSKTYEYVWNTSVAGDYTVTATAHEGTEGVTAQAAARHTLYKAALGDRVWIDSNGNGAQDAGEPGLTNVTVRLLDAANNVVAVTATDSSGSYAFTNLPPAAYRVEFVAPPLYVFSKMDAASADDLAVSDADRVTGRTPLTALGAAETNLTLDAGLYIPSTLFGYIFKDKNENLVRDPGDGTITNRLVRLTVNGALAASTNTDAQGFYRFENIPVGAVTVLVSRVDATLADVPESSDPMRNRALPDDLGEDAYVPFAAMSGYGVLADLPGEPLNFGFVSYVLSSAIGLRVFAGKNGVMIDLWTVDESGCGDIVIYAWIGNAWVAVGRVPASDVVGEGSNKYRIQAAGLDADGEYYFRVVDESGHVHDLPAPVSVKKIKLNAMRLSLGTAELTFTTEHGIKYAVKVSDSLAAAEEAWESVPVSVQKANGWSAYSDKPFMAGTGSQTVVRLPVDKQKAFFKIVEAAE